LPPVLPTIFSPVTPSYANVGPPAAAGVKKFEMTVNGL
jgi:hypothetical protein